MPTHTRTVDLVYFNAGGGHRAAAQALQSVIAEQQRPWQVRLVNLFEVLDAQQRFKRWFGIAPEDLYNRRLASGRTFGMRQELKLLQAAIRLANRPMRSTLERHWRASAPDLVVSLVPNFNRALAQSVRSASPDVPFVTVMTDMADHPPNFWMQPEEDQFLVCGTPEAIGQARARGCAPESLALVGGMVLRPGFRRDLAIDVGARRAELGLDPTRPTGLVMFGGPGAQQMLDVARAMPDVQLILLCGHHQGLLASLRALKRNAPHAAIGFTQEVPELMRLADFFVGKPGPGCLSEAVQMGLPVVTFDNRATIPQERFNAQWVRDKGLGVVVDAWQRLPDGVAALLAVLDTYRQRVARVENRAAHEVVEILAAQLAVQRRAGSAAMVAAAA